MDLPLTLNVDEIAVLEQVASPEDLREAPFSCFTEVLPHRQGDVATLFPDASSRHDGEVPAPDWWSDTSSELRVMHLFKIRDAFVFPAWGVVVDRSGRVMRLTMEEAAYASADLAALPHVAARGGSMVLAVPDTVETAPRVAVTLPSGARDNYGHFVLDALSGAIALDDSGLFGDFARVAPPLKPWQRRHFALLGVRPHETTAGILRVEEVIYTNAIHHFLHTPNLVYRALRARQVASLDDRPAPGSPRLYLSRGPRNNRPMRSEARLRRGLARAGFETIETDRFSVDEQIARFAAAEVVIGSSGAALANAVYCRAGTVVIEIQPAGMENLWVQRLCLVNGLHYGAWFCGARAADPNHPERRLHYDVDVGRFLAFVATLVPSVDRPARRPGLIARLLDRARSGAGPS